MDKRNTHFQTGTINGLASSYPLIFIFVAEKAQPTCAGEIQTEKNALIMSTATGSDNFPSPFLCVCL